MTVILPTLNEAEALPKVVEELRQAGYTKILVVDGGSTDGTVEEAKRLGLTVIRQDGRGKGMALRTALMYVDTPYVAVMDADYTYPPAELSKLLPLLREYDLVLGSRRGEMSAIYRAGNKILSWVFRALFGADIVDPLTGMYAARTDLLREASLEAKHFDIEVDILAKALSLGARVAEVPITYRKRIGRKKLRPWHGLSILGKIVSLAYRLNPSISLFLLGALLTIPGILLAGWVGYEFFYGGVPHYMLGMLALIMILLGGISLALLPIAGSLVRLQAAVFRSARRPAPVDCLPPLQPPGYEEERPQTQSAMREELTAFAHVGRGLVLAFMALLGIAAYYLGVGDTYTADKLAEWAYYALAGSVVLLLIDAALASRRRQP